MPRLIVLAIAAALAFPAFAQEAAPHMLPFASTGHALELEVAHTATDEEDAAAPTAVTVRLTDAPAWLAVTPAAVTLDALTPGSDALARFAFDVTEDAPVGEPGAMTFALATPDGQTWTKTVRVEVAAPEAFAVAGAYPNPFAHAAEVVYDLPAGATVTFAVYDLLGRVVHEVRTEQAAGRHTAAVDGAGLASGVYVWRLVAVGADGQRHTEAGRLTRAR
ncbi:MAG: T9SS type A sorting domain-containing protein [Bacteroidota bacterium]